MKSKKGKQLIQRIFSLAISFVFICSVCLPQDQGSFLLVGTQRDLSKLKQQQHPLSLSLPEQFGYVKEVYIPAENSSVRTDDLIVLHIRDAHTNYSAQKNIQKIIEHAVKKYGFEVVAVEGSTGEIATQVFSSFPDKKVLQETCDYFIRQGTLTGAEGLRITSKSCDFKLYGVEDPDLYLQNLALFKENLSYRERALHTVYELEDAIGLLKKKMLPQGYLILEEKMHAFESGTVSIQGYLEYLIGEAERQDVALEQFLNIQRFLAILENQGAIDQQLLGKEQEAVMLELSKRMVKEDLSRLVQKGLEFRLGKLSANIFFSLLKDVCIQNRIDLAAYPHLQKYFNHIALYSAIDNEMLLFEITFFSEVVLHSFLRTDIERHLCDLQKKVALYERCFKLEMSRSDLEDFTLLEKTEGLSEEIIFLTRLLERHAISMDIKADSAFVEKQLDRAKAFYAVAKKRDKALIEATRSLSNKLQKKKIILITGGFHTDGMTRYMREKNIPHVVAIPLASSSTDMGIYTNLLTDGMSGFGYIVSPEKFYLAVTSFLNALTGDPETSRLLEQAFLHSFALVGEAGEMKKVLAEGDDTFGRLENPLQDIHDQWQASAPGELAFLNAVSFLPFIVSTGEDQIVFARSSLDGTKETLIAFRFYPEQKEKSIVSLGVHPEQSGRFGDYMLEVYAHKQIARLLTNDILDLCEDEYIPQIIILGLLEQLLEEENIAGIHSLIRRLADKEKNYTENSAAEMTRVFSRILEYFENDEKRYDEFFVAIEHFNQEAFSNEAYRKAVNVLEPYANTHSIKKQLSELVRILPLGEKDRILEGIEQYPNLFSDASVFLLLRGNIAQLLLLYPPDSDIYQQAEAILNQLEEVLSQQFDGVIIGQDNFVFDKQLVQKEKHPYLEKGLTSEDKDVILGELSKSSLIAQAVFLLHGIRVSAENIESITVSFIDKGSFKKAVLLSVKTRDRVYPLVLKMPHKKTYMDSPGFPGQVHLQKALSRYERKPVATFGVPGDEFWLEEYVPGKTVDLSMEKREDEEYVEHASRIKDLIRFVLKGYLQFVILSGFRKIIIDSSLENYHVADGARMARIVDIDHMMLHDHVTYTGGLLTIRDALYDLLRENGMQELMDDVYTDILETILDELGIEGLLVYVSGILSEHYVDGEFYPYDRWMSEHILLLDACFEFLSTIIASKELDEEMQIAIQDHLFAILSLTDVDRSGESKIDLTFNETRPDTPVVIGRIAREVLEDDSLSLGIDDVEVKASSMGITDIDAWSVEEMLDLYRERALDKRYALYFHSKMPFDLELVFYRYFASFSHGDEKDAVLFSADLLRDIVSAETRVFFLRHETDHAVNPEYETITNDVKYFMSLDTLARNKIIADIYLLARQDERARDFLNILMRAQVTSGTKKVRGKMRLDQYVKDLVLSFTGLENKSLELPDGTRLRYSTGGREGSPVTLLFMHGWLLNARDWRPQLAHLETKYRTITMDTPGFGKSVMGKQKPSMDDYAGYVKAVLEAEDAHNVVIIGHSMGGMIGMHYDDLYKDMSEESRVEGFVPIASSAIITREGIMKFFSRNFVAANLEVLRFTPAFFAISKIWSKDILRRVLKLGRIRDVFWRIIQERVISKGTTEFFDRAYSSVTKTSLDSITDALVAIMQHNVVGRLPDIEVPVLWIIGEEDGVLSSKMQRQHVSKIRDVQMRSFPDASHFPHVTNYWEVSRAIDAFARQRVMPRIFMKELRALILDPRTNEKNVVAIIAGLDDRFLDIVLDAGDGLTFADVLKTLRTSDAVQRGYVYSSLKRIFTDETQIELEDVSRVLQTLGQIAHFPLWREGHEDPDTLAIGTVDEQMRFNLVKEFITDARLTQKKINKVTWALRYLAKTSPKLVNVMLPVKIVRNSRHPIRINSNDGMIEVDVDILDHFELLIVGLHHEYNHFILRDYPDGLAEIGCILYDLQFLESRYELNSRFIKTLLATMRSLERAPPGSRYSDLIESTFYLDFFLKLLKTVTVLSSSEDPYNHAQFLQRHRIAQRIMQERYIMRKTVPDILNGLMNEIGVVSRHEDDEAGFGPDELIETPRGFYDYVLKYGSEYEFFYNREITMDDYLKVTKPPEEVVKSYDEDNDKMEFFTYEEVLAMRDFTRRYGKVPREIYEEMIKDTGIEAYRGYIKKHGFVPVEIYLARTGRSLYDDALQRRISEGMIIDAKYPDFHLGDRESGGYGIGFRRNVSVQWLSIKALEKIAGKIHEMGNRGIIFVGGLTAAGKTETTDSIERKLPNEIVTISLDDYYFGASHIPKDLIDDQGRFDWDDPRALDWELIADHVQALMRGEEIRVPEYDFATSERVKGSYKRLRLKEGQKLVLEGIHALNERCKGIVPEGIPTLKLFVFAPPAERLLRKLIRDVKVRKRSLASVLNSWEIARDVEKRYMIPELTGNHADEDAVAYYKQADIIVDTSKPYELGMYRRVLEAPVRHLVSRFSSQLNANARRVSESILATFQEVTPQEIYIPKGSLLWKMFHMEGEDLSLPGVEAAELGPPVIVGNQAWKLLEEANHFHFVVRRLKDKYLSREYQSLPAREKDIFNLLGELYKTIAVQNIDETALEVILGRMIDMMPATASEKQLTRMVNLFKDSFQNMYANFKNTQTDAQKVGIISAASSQFLQIAAILLGRDFSVVAQERIWSQGLDWFVKAFAICEDPDNVGKTLYSLYTEYEQEIKKVFGDQDWFKKEKDDANLNALKVLPLIEESIVAFRRYIDDDSFWYELLSERPQEDVKDELIGLFLQISKPYRQVFYQFLQKDSIENPIIKKLMENYSSRYFERYGKEADKQELATYLLQLLRRFVLLRIYSLLAIAGNTMDFGHKEFYERLQDPDFNLAETILEGCIKILREGLNIDNVDAYAARIENLFWELNDLQEKYPRGIPLKKMPEIVMMTDNAGETVLELSMVRYLLSLGLNVTISPRSEPIINDITAEELVELIEEHFPDLQAFSKQRSLKVIATGSRMYFTETNRLRKQFKRAFKRSSLVIALGQGNLETWWNLMTEKDIVHILRYKTNLIPGFEVPGGSNIVAINSGLHEEQITMLEQMLDEFAYGLRPLSHPKNQAIREFLIERLGQRNIGDFSRIFVTSGFDPAKIDHGTVIQPEDGIIFINDEVVIGKGVIVGPNTWLRSCTIGDNSELRNAIVIHSTLKPYTTVIGSRIVEDAVTHPISVKSPTLVARGIKPLSTQRAKLRYLQKRGVIIIDPMTTYIDDSVTLSNIKPCILHPSVMVKGRDTFIDEGAVIGPWTTVRESIVSARAQISESIINRSFVLPGEIIRGETIEDRQKTIVERGQGRVLGFLSNMLVNRHGYVRMLGQIISGVLPQEVHKQIDVPDLVDMGVKPLLENKFLNFESFLDGNNRIQIWGSLNGDDATAEVAMDSIMSKALHLLEKYDPELAAIARAAKVYLFKATRELEAALTDEFNVYRVAFVGIEDLQSIYFDADFWEILKNMSGEKYIALAGLLGNMALRIKYLREEGVTINTISNANRLGESITNEISGKIGYRVTDLFIEKKLVERKSQELIGTLSLQQMHAQAYLALLDKRNLNRFMSRDGGIERIKRLNEEIGKVHYIEARFPRNRITWLLEELSTLLVMLLEFNVLKNQGYGTEGIQRMIIAEHLSVVGISKLLKNLHDLQAKILLDDKEIKELSGRLYALKNALQDIVDQLQYVESLQRKLEDHYGHRVTLARFEVDEFGDSLYVLNVSGKKVSARKLIKKISDFASLNMVFIGYYDDKLMWRSMGRHKKRGDKFLIEGAVDSNDAEKKSYKQNRQIIVQFAQRIFTEQVLTIAQLKLAFLGAQNAEEIMTSTFIFALSPISKNKLYTLDLYTVMRQSVKILRRVLRTEVLPTQTAAYINEAITLLEEMGEYEDKPGTNLLEYRKKTFGNAIHALFATFKKAETHHHISGSISPDIALKLYWKYPKARAEFVQYWMKSNQENSDDLFYRYIGGPDELKRGKELQRLFEMYDVGSEEFHRGFIDLCGGEKAYGQALSRMKEYIEYRPLFLQGSIEGYLKKLETGAILLRQGVEANRIISRESALESFREDSIHLFEMRASGFRPESSLPMDDAILAMIAGLMEAERISEYTLQTGLILVLRKEPSAVLGRKRYREIVDIAKGMTEEEVLELVKTEHDWHDLVQYLESLNLSSEEKKKRMYVLFMTRKEALRQMQELVKLRKNWSLSRPEFAKRIVGIDTAGSELKYFNWTHIPALRYAYMNDLGITSHVGESWNPGEFKEALMRIKREIRTGVVKRIGHATALGIIPQEMPGMSVEQRREISQLQIELLNEIIERDIPVESNPTSNLLLSSDILDYSRHLIKFLMNRGVSTLISQDNKWILHTRGQSGELMKVWLGHPDMKFSDILQIIRNGFHYSFTMMKEGATPRHLPVMQHGSYSAVPVVRGVVGEGFNFIVQEQYATTDTVRDTIRKMLTQALLQLEIEYPGIVDVSMPVEVLEGSLRPIRINKMHDILEIDSMLFNNPNLLTFALYHDYMHRKVRFEKPDISLLQEEIAVIEHDVDYLKKRIEHGKFDISAFVQGLRQLEYAPEKARYSDLLLLLLTSERNHTELIRTFLRNQPELFQIEVVQRILQGLSSDMPVAFEIPLSFQEDIRGTEVTEADQSKSIIASGYVRVQVNKEGIALHLPEKDNDISLRYVSRALERLKRIGIPQTTLVKIFQGAVQTTTEGMTLKEAAALYVKNRDIGDLERIISERAFDTFQLTPSKSKNAEILVQELLETMQQNNAKNTETILGISLDGTPQSLFDELLRYHREKGVDFSRLRVINIAEKRGVSSQSDTSDYTTLLKSYLRELQIPEDRVIGFDGALEDEVAQQEFERAITDIDSIDFVVLGVNEGGVYSNDHDSQTSYPMSKIAPRVQQFILLSESDADTTSLVRAYAERGISDALLPELLALGQVRCMIPFEYMTPFTKVHASDNAELRRLWLLALGWVDIKQLEYFSNQIVQSIRDDNLVNKIIALHLLAKIGDASFAQQIREVIEYLISDEGTRLFIDNFGEQGEYLQYGTILPLYLSAHSFIRELIQEAVHNRNQDMSMEVLPPVSGSERIEQREKARALSGQAA